MDRFDRRSLVNLGLVVVILAFGVGLLASSCTLVPGARSSSTAATLQASNAPLVALQSSFREVAHKVTPAVVEIDVEQVVEQNVPKSPFDFFFSPRGPEQSPREFRNQGLGSGVMVQRDGRRIYVLTNNHVVGEADKIDVKLHDGRSFRGKLVGGDPRKDLALVVFETGDDVPLAALGDSDQMQVGDWALAIGNPFGLDSTVTAGIISAVGRRGGPGENISEFLQTDAAISPGNSGGALVNIGGEVIGINTWIASNTGGSQGYGFAIPINAARKAIDDFIKIGRVEYAWLGVQIQTVNPAIAGDLGVAGRKGALITQVFKGAPADKGGLQPGDYVVNLNGKDVADHLDLTNKLGDQPPGRQSEFVVVRQGKDVKVSIRLAVREDEKAITAQNRNLWPGVAVFPVTEEVRNTLGLKAAGGVVVYSVVAESPGAVAGFKENDLIVRMGGTPVRGLRDFYERLAAQPKVQVVVARAGTEVTLDLAK
jgi:serine protease Do